MKKNLKAIICFSFLCLVFLPLVSVSAAAQLEDPLKLGNNGINELAKRIINGLLGVSGIAALLSFIYGGILWMTAGLSADNIKKGKTVMVWAVAGLLVIFSSYAIITFIFGVLTGK